MPAPDQTDMTPEAIAKHINHQRNSHTRRILTGCTIIAIALIAATAVLLKLIS